jgi:glycosyltransferase involved in cell wall biosynthesis
LKELHLTLGSALALAYVSYFEGFGIPLVEAMRCEVPVLTGDKTSLPEVAGEAALFCDPFSIESIADGLLRLANEDDLRKSLIEKGKIRAQKFSWNHTTDVIWNAILKVVNAQSKIS